ncbi:hypothetical protein E2C01_073917 [Portunus trituberculatus]|uniref:Uncharacterized protein n=1 Tax=Portunus trituberculatus TaxID=210409 RepID=A0A5B7I205_PORTR|nr:hypothetical protein [Portunus trituberculatus]
MAGLVHAHSPHVTVWTRLATTSIPTWLWELKKIQTEESVRRRVARGPFPHGGKVRVCRGLLFMAPSVSSRCTAAIKKLLQRCKVTSHCGEH